MNECIKTLSSRKTNLIIRTLIACLIAITLSVAILPARANDDEAAAQKAFNDWKAAREKVEEKQKAVKAAEKERSDYLALIKDDKNPTADEQAGLQALNNKVAEAQAALKAAEDELQAAFNRLTEALAKLPEDNALRKELMRQRDILLGHKQTSLSPQTQQIVQTASKTTGGLQITTFDTANGRVIVNLPDDMRAGDTISGTVMAEPKGQTPEERAKNMAVLSGYVIEVQPPKNPDGTSNPKVKAEVTAPPPQLRVILPPGSTLAPPVTNVSRANSSGLGITLTNTSGSFSAAGTTTVPIEMVALSLQSSAPLNTFQLPTMGQPGRPIVITGPFDGNSSNTGLSYRPCVRSADCAGSPSAWVASGDLIVAESPRQAVFTAPTNVTGPMEIRVNEGTTETRAPFRNVGVNLSAPKTSLLKGESTTLKIEVSGLQGITEPVPLHLVKGGVVTMLGGDVQSMTIKPEEVQSNGTFTTTRTITGVQTGVWNATATVVVFDTCLQDDNSGDLVVYNSVTGDFIFCQGRRNLAGANPISLSTLNFGGSDFTGGVRVAAGDINDSGGSGPGLVSIGPGASMHRNGAVTVADFNYKPGYIHVQIDGYTNTGNAMVQTTKPKQTFTITDRDTRNNTCGCK